MTCNWILKAEEKDSLALTQPQKYAVLKMYCAASHFSKEEKDALKALVLKDDNTDEGKVVAKACELILPEAELKERLWKEITDPETKEPQKDLMQKMGCFFQRRQQLDLIKPFFAKYYECLQKVAETRDREFTEVFMNHLNPSFMGGEEDLAQFTSILSKVNPEQEFVVNFLKKQIESIELFRKSRALCEKFKA